MTITALLLGIVIGAVGLALFLPSLNKRTRDRHADEIANYESVIADLRSERTHDREINRRLRHELATNTPQNFESTRDERDSAREELERLQAELVSARHQAAEQDRALREARLAIHDIRVQIERERFGVEPEAAGQADPAPIADEAGLGGDRAAEAYDDEEGFEDQGFEDQAYDDEGYEDQVYEGAHDGRGYHDRTYDDESFEGEAFDDELVGQDGGDDHRPVDERASTVFFGEYPIGEATKS